MKNIEVKDELNNGTDKGNKAAGNLKLVNHTRMVRNVFQCSPPVPTKAANNGLEAESPVKLQQLTQIREMKEPAKEIVVKDVKEGDQVIEMTLVEKSNESHRKKKSDLRGLESLMVPSQDSMYNKEEDAVENYDHLLSGSMTLQSVPTGQSEKSSSSKIERIKSPKGSKFVNALPTIVGAESSEHSTVMATEADYDKNPTKLFMLIQNKKWEEAQNYLQENKAESKVWIFRRQKDISKLRWKLLPLHASLVFKAPDALIEALIEANPSATRESDDRGLTPLHLAFRHKSSDFVLLLLLKASPECISMADQKGRLPIDMMEGPANKASLTSSEENSSIGSELPKSGFAYYVLLACKNEKEILQAQLEEQKSHEINEIKSQQEQIIQNEIALIEKELMERFEYEKAQISESWKIEYETVTDGLAGRHEDEKRELQQFYEDTLHRMHSEQEVLKEQMEQIFQIRLDGQRDEYEAAQARQAETIGRLEQERDEVLSEVYSLEEKNKSLEKMIRDMEANANAEDEARLMLIGEMNAVSAERESLQDKIDKQTKRADELSDENEKLKEELKKLKHEIELLSKNLHQVTKENEKNEASLRHEKEIREAGDMAIARITEENRHLVRQKEQLSLDHKKEMSELRMVADRANEENRRLLQDVASIRQSSDDDVRKQLLKMLHSSTSSHGFEPSLSYSRTAANRESIFRDSPARSARPTESPPLSMKGSRFTNDIRAQHRVHERSTNANLNDTEDDDVSSTFSADDLKRGDETAITLLDERNQFMQSLARLKETMGTNDERSYRAEERDEAFHRISSPRPRVASRANDREDSMKSPLARGPTTTDFSPKMDTSRSQRYQSNIKSNKTVSFRNKTNDNWLAF